MGIILEGNLINVIDSFASLERNQKQEFYIDYIENHRERVKAAYEKYFIPLLDKDFELKSCSTEDFKIAIREAMNNIIIHDESKYSDIEFEPYRRWFYSTTEEKKALEQEDILQQLTQDYTAAWTHHEKTNPHHQLYWVQDDGTIRDMELKYIIEMICDWLSFGDDIRYWYQNKAKDEKNNMSTRTKEITEELMDLIL